MNISRRFSFSLLFVALAGCGASDGNVVTTNDVSGPTAATPVTPTPVTPGTPVVTPTTPQTGTPTTPATGAPSTPTTNTPITNTPATGTPTTPNPAVSNPVPTTPVTPIEMPDPTVPTNTPVLTPTTPTQPTTPPTTSTTPSSADNLLSSAGMFDGGFEGFTVASSQNTSARGEASFTIANLPSSANPWDVQMWHSVTLEQAKQYTICYDAKAAISRQIEINIDDNDPTYASVLGDPINGKLLQDITTSYRSYSHTFESTQSLSTARLTFNMASQNGDIQLDNIGIFEGARCGMLDTSNPQPTTPPITTPPSNTPTATPAAGWTIEKIGCDDPDDYNGEAMVLFDGSGNFDGTFGNKDFSQNEFANLSRQGAADYVLSSAAVNDASCSQRKVHTGTWLKKLADATNQHSNFVNKFSFNNKTIGDIENIVLELRINSALTDIPSKQDLVDQYGSVIGENGVNLLDNGKVNFAITLGDPDATDDEVRAEVFLEIDQSLYRDEWIRVTIPKNAFYFWKNENWNKTPVSLEDASSVVPTRIAFFPETKGNGAPKTHGFTVRNVYGYNEWTDLSPTPEEDFKEMNISIRTFEVRFEPTPVGGIPQTPVTGPEPEPQPTTESQPEPTPSTPAGVSAQETQTRIAAGKLIFETGEKNCTACHGQNGNSGAFGSLLLSNPNNICSTCSTSYDDLVSVIANGVPGSVMPACEPKGNCAKPLADYVWAGLNGKALPVENETNNGGSAPSANGFITENFEQGTLQAVPQGWRTFVGYVPDNNNAAAQIYVDDTRAYSGTKSLKVDGGTGPVQIVKAIPEGVERVYIRAWIYMDRTMGNDSTDNHEHIFAIKQNENGSFSANNEVRVGQGKGHLGFNLVPDSDAISPNADKWFSGPQTPANEWYCAEAAFITDTAYDEIHFSVNGNVVNSATSANDWHAPVAADWLTGDLGFAALGWHSFSSHKATLWIDDIVISQSPIGCN